MLGQVSRGQCGDRGTINAAIDPALPACIMNEFLNVFWSVSL